MMLRIPRTAMDFHLFVRRMLFQVLANMNRSETQRPGPISVQQRSIKETPEPAFHLRRSEPSPVFTIRPGRYQRRKIAKFRPFADLMLKPTRIKPRELRVGQLAVARHYVNLCP